MKFLSKNQYTWKDNLAYYASIILFVLPMKIFIASIVLILLIGLLQYAYSLIRKKAA
jgi:hypothetical protein